VHPLHLYDINCLKYFKALYFGPSLYFLSYESCFELFPSYFMNGPDGMDEIIIYVLIQIIIMCLVYHLVHSHPLML
jgi:hypothetical protein